MSIKHFFTVVLRKASFDNVPKHPKGLPWTLSLLKLKIIWSCLEVKGLLRQRMFLRNLRLLFESIYEYLSFIAIFDQALDNPRLKTEICRNYAERGHCLYGNSCQFAHGTGVSLLYNIFVEHLSLLWITLSIHHFVRSILSHLRAHVVPSSLLSYLIIF